MVSADGARRRLASHMAAGTFEGPMPSSDAQAVRTWTNTYKSLATRGRGQGQNPEQMKYQAAGGPTQQPQGEGVGQVDPQDPKDFLIGMYLRKNYGIPGVFYGR